MRGDSMGEKRSLLRFSKFMSQSLYGENGYYTNLQKVGERGDFYTSVSASKFFGGSIAFYILKLLEQGQLTPPLRIIEIGADKGYLLGDIAQFLDALTENLLESCEFATIEPLLNLANFQKTYFQNLKLVQKTSFNVYSPDIYISLLKSPQNKEKDLIVISNELLDSFPCEVICNNQMLYVDCTAQTWKPVWQEIPKSIQKMWHNYAQKSGKIEKCPASVSQQNNQDSITPLSPLSQSFILPHWDRFIDNLQTLAKEHRQMYFLSFDYGSHALYNPLSYNPRFYYNHQVLRLEEILTHKLDLHILYQQADVTYDVDFTLVNNLLVEVGFIKLFNQSQAQTLLDMGILELLEIFKKHNHAQFISEIQKVKTILNTMGERFMGICYKYTQYS